MNTITFDDAMWHLITTAAAENGFTPELFVNGVVLAEVITRAKLKAATAARAVAA